MSIKQTFTILFLLIALTRSQTGFTTETYSILGCKTTEYFDSTEQMCLTCPANLEPTNDQTSCKCIAGYIKTYIDGPDFQSCQACPSGKSSNQERTFCQGCNEGYITGTRECNCGTQRGVQEKDFAGNYLATKKCIDCSKLSKIKDGQQTYKPRRFSNFIVRYSLGCNNCPHEGQEYDALTNQCVCVIANGWQAAGDICILSTEAAALNQIVVLNNFAISQATTWNEVGGIKQTITASIFETFWVKSASSCYLYNVEKSCQILANLCVLHQGDMTNPICKFYLSVQSRETITLNFKQGWKKGYPWLYYQEKVSDIMDANDIIMQMAIKTPIIESEVHNMDFWLLKYTVEGDYLGMEQLKNQLFLCPHNQEEGVKMKEFGIQFIQSCTINAKDWLADSKDMFFYELYLKDVDGHFIDVPVMLKYLKNEQQVQPNLNFERSVNNQFIRRFFLVDSMTGIEKQYDYNDVNKTKQMRFPHDIILKFELKTTNQQKIYRPLLQIVYQEVSIPTSPNTMALINTNFRTEYVIDHGNLKSECVFWFRVMIFFQVLIILFSTWISYMKYNHERRNTNDSMSLFYFLWEFLKACFVILGLGFYGFLLILGGIGFIVYKGQQEVYTLMPSWGDDATFWSYYNRFHWIWSISAICICMQMFVIINKQCGIDVFFIDWERDQTFENQRTGSGKKSSKGVSIWRTLLICNEFNELQIERYISRGYTFFFAAFFLIGRKWENMAVEQPTMTTDINGVQINWFLRWFINNMTLLCLGLIQITFQHLISLKIQTPIQDFTDLLPVSNISLWISNVNDKQHGYYVHGQAPGGDAEGTAEDLKKALLSEGSHTSRSRGLIASDKKALQTFEILINPSLRKIYDDVFMKSLLNELEDKRNDQNNQKRSSKYNNNVFGNFNLYQTAIPDNFDFEKIEKKKQNLLKHLKRTIQQVASEHINQVIEKSMQYKLFSIPSDNLEDEENMIKPKFMRDPGFGYQNIFLMGCDVFMLIFNIFCFSFFDILFDNIMYATLFAYFVDRILCEIRQQWGEYNLSQKTMIDQRFLI